MKVHNMLRMLWRRWITKTVAVFLLLLLLSVLLLWKLLPSSAPVTALVVGLAVLLFYGWIRYLWLQKKTWEWLDTVVPLVPAALIAFFFAWWSYTGQNRSGRESETLALREALRVELLGDFSLLCRGSRTALQLVTRTEDANLDPLASTMLTEAAKSGLFHQTPTNEMLVISTYIDRYNRRSQRVSGMAFDPPMGVSDTSQLLSWEQRCTSQITALNELKEMLALKIRWLYISLSLNKTPFKVGDQWYALGWASYPERPWDSLGPPDTTCRPKLRDPAGDSLPNDTAE